ncbi:MAG: UDP-3-O-(3-hydroxymyristoyl)glucosamine N-acyltransferase [Thermodesulfobacteriota bacterium]
MLLSRLAEALGLELRGEDREVCGVNTLEAAGPDQVSFLANPKYTGLLAATRAAAVIVDEAHASAAAAALVSANPYLDFARALTLFARPQGCLEGRSELAFIHPEARVAEDATVYPFAFVGARAEVGPGCALFPHVYVGEDCVLGPGCVLHPGAALMAGTRLGARVLVGPGTVLGSEGFGFAQDAGGRMKIPQVGVVEVGDDVEFGANTAVDRAALDKTRIGSRCKIDNLVQVGHNVVVGDDSVLVAQVGISGSTKVGRGVVMAGQVGVAGHISIGDGAIIGPKSGVPHDVPAGKRVGGIPVMDEGLYMRNLALAPKLPDLARRVRRMEKDLEELKELLRKGGEHEG